jgi:hypothetical protein
MKPLAKFWLLILILSSSVSLQAQVGIGTNDPDTSVILDIRSPTKGILLPRVVDMNSVSKREGSLIYDSVTGKIKCYYKTNWLNINPLSTDVNNNVTAPGNVNIKGDLKIKGLIDTTINVSKSIHVYDTTVTRLLKVQNNAVVTGNQSVGGNLNVTGRVTAGSFSGNGSLLTAVDAATLGGSPKSFYAPEDSITNIKSRLNGRVSFKVSPAYATVYWDESSYLKIGRLVIVDIRFCFRTTFSNNDGHNYLYIYVDALPYGLPTNTWAVYTGNVTINPTASTDTRNVHLTFFKLGNNGNYYLYAQTQDGSNFSRSVDQPTNIIELQFYYYSYSSNM